MWKILLEFIRTRGGCSLSCRSFGFVRVDVREVI